MNYADLVTEAQIRTDDPNVAARADYLTRMAEREIERVLRVGQMERVAVLTTGEDGLAELPGDFLQARVNGADIDRGNVIGDPGADIVLRYYARLPSVVDTGTNWLLEADPEIYVSALMAQVFTVAVDIEKANAARSYLGGLIGALQRADSAARYAGRRVRLAGITGGRYDR